MLAGLLFSLLASVANAALTPTAIFGPESYLRGSGQPLNITNSFTSSRPGESCLLQVYNGGLEDSEVELVSSSVITFNGSQVVSPNEFNQSVAFIEKTVTVNASNEIAVEVRGKPGGGITVQVACERDLEPPTIQATLSSVPNGAGWHHQDVTVTFSCSDADSAIASCSAPVVISTEGGGQLISGEAVDEFGNTASTSVTINLDKFDPTISAIKNPLSNANGWNNADVTVSFTCADSSSGIATCPASIPLSTEGAGQIISGTATDIAGKSATASTKVSIDKTPPEIIATDIPAANSAGWHNSDVEVSFSCNDEPSGSGITSCPLTRIVTTEGANQLESGSVLDLAGNSSTDSVALNIDKTVPVISIVDPADGVVDYDDFVTVSGVVSDASEVSSVTINSITVTINGSGEFTHAVPLVAGANAITVQAVDIADNSSSTVISVTQMQSQPPVIVSSPLTIVLANTLYNYDVEASDPNIGDQLTYSLITAPTGMVIDGFSGVIQWTPIMADVGAHSVTIQVTDSAGAEDSQVFSITVHTADDVIPPDPSAVIPLLTPAIPPPTRILSDPDSVVF